MPHEGYANPVTNNGPGFYLDIPVRELTEHVTRAIKASNVSSAPLVVETTDGVTHETRPTPRPRTALGSMLCHARPPAMPDVWVGARRLGPRSQKRWLRTLASQKIPQAILPESPKGSGATPTGCARMHPLANRKIP